MYCHPVGFPSAVLFPQVSQLVLSRAILASATRAGKKAEKIEKSQKFLGVECGSNRSPYWSKTCNSCSHFAPAWKYCNCYNYCSCCNSFSDSKSTFAIFEFLQRTISPKKRINCGKYCKYFPESLGVDLHSVSLFAAGSAPGLSLNILPSEFFACNIVQYCSILCDATSDFPIRNIWFIFFPHCISNRLINLTGPCLWLRFV